MAEGVMGKTGESSTSAPPLVKISLFTKSSFKKPTEDEEAVDFFSRAKDLFPKIVAQKEQRQKDKIIKLERKRSNASRVALAGARDGKKRRLSGEGTDESGHSADDDDDHARASTTSTTPGIRRSRSGSVPHKKIQGSPTSLSQRYKKELEVEKQKAEEKKVVIKGYISLSDSEDASDAVVKRIKEPAPKPDVLDRKETITPRKLNPSIQEEDDDLQMSDEEFPELVARARERARQKELVRLTATNILSITPEQRPEVENDPVIEIFISSYIPNSTPLVIKRRLSQALKVVRLSWCDKQIVNGQPLDLPTKSNIFLTWRNKRLFDVTTCKAMGLKVDENGKLYSKGGGIDSDGRVHMEAWTEDLFAVHQKRLEADRRRLANPIFLEEEGREEEEQREPVEEVPKTKLIVRAKNMPDFKTIVKPNTLVSKVMSAFRIKHGLREDKEVALYFDGDKLEPDMKCGDADFEDMDVVEAHME